MFRPCFQICVSGILIAFSLTELRGRSSLKHSLAQKQGYGHGQLNLCVMLPLTL